MEQNNLPFRSEHNENENKPSRSSRSSNSRGNTPWPQNRNQRSNHINRHTVNNNAYFSRQSGIPPSGYIRQNYENYHRPSHHNFPSDYCDNNFHYQRVNKDHDTLKQPTNCYRKQNIDSRKEKKEVKTVFPDKVDTSKLDQRELLIHELSTNKYECIICINVIQKEAAIHSCIQCSHLFHLYCIKKWAKTAERWRCPCCQTETEASTNRLSYKCFCGRQTDPSYRPGVTPHSCGDVCGRRRDCSHECVLLCHPGPCPPCEASLDRPCLCGRARITARCTAPASHRQCQEVCGLPLMCGLHVCQSVCHPPGDDHGCPMTIEVPCWCGVVSRTAACNQTTPDSCGGICGRVLPCGDHCCPRKCHEGPCLPCTLLCFCGRSQTRPSCLEPRQSCGGLCGRVRPSCGHPCPEKCHEGACPPCSLTSPCPCRCGLSAPSLSCEGDRAPLCTVRCTARLSCGKHRCDRRCCEYEVHLCPSACGRRLSCGAHRCERECGHAGGCGDCPNVSFEELTCECGSSVVMPPVACGTAPPRCGRPCTRAHPCGHPARHECHRNETCPPCTELVSKPCPGGHASLHHVPCFRPVPTCGLPCARPLPGCAHLCVRLCHEGACLDQGPCRQPCASSRPSCGHPCGAPCHDDDDCPLEAAPCLAPVPRRCPCGLRQTATACNDLAPLDLLACDLTCASALAASRQQAALLSSASSSSSYSCIQRYYAAYFQEFVRYNLQFSQSVEAVFCGFYEDLLAAGDCEHRFTSLSLEKAQFVKRYSTAFGLGCLQSRNEDGTVTVVVRATKATYCRPSVMVTRKVLDHFFKTA